MIELDYIVNHYLAIAGIMSPNFTCDKTKKIMWRCFAEDFEALEKSFLDVMKDTRRPLPEFECPRVVREAKKEVDIDIWERLRKRGIEKVWMSSKEGVKT